MDGIAVERVPIGAIGRVFISRNRRNSAAQALHNLSGPLLLRPGPARAAILVTAQDTRSGAGRSINSGTPTDGIKEDGDTG